MLQLQEVEDRKIPAVTTWAAEFLLRGGESREFLGLWITSGVVHEAKRRRATQVITCSFPCGKWLHMIGAHASPGCELCKRERQHRKETIDNIRDVLPWEDVADEAQRRRLTMGGCSETSYHGRMLQMKRKGYLIFTRLAEMLHTKIAVTVLGLSKKLVA
jgi:hypothetical protein